PLSRRRVARRVRPVDARRVEPSRIPRQSRHALSDSRSAGAARVDSRIGAEAVESGPRLSADTKGSRRTGSGARLVEGVVRRSGPAIETFHASTVDVSAPSHLLRIS